MASKGSFVDTAGEHSYMYRKADKGGGLFPMCLNLALTTSLRVGGPGGLMVVSPQSGTAGKSLNVLSARVLQ